MTAAQEVSGKVFRFLSAMHPALSKAERKRYAAYDPDSWYQWDNDVSSEFTELMRRSPRDTSFARGFAYVAQRAVPEGTYIPPKDLLSHLDRLPAAFRGPDGTGFTVSADRPGHARVRYSGMPGFSNVCIAIQGELAQRLQAAGAQSVVVKHTPTCRVNGGEACEFEVEWSGEAPPPDADVAAIGELLGPEVEEVQKVSETISAAPAATPAATSTTPSQAFSQPTAAPVQSAVDAMGVDASGEDLFVQLRKRLAEADRQSRLFAEAQAEIDRLRVELARIRAQADAEVAQAQKERNETVEAMSELRRRIRAVVADD